MTYSELQLLKDKKVNDNNWSCLVILLIEGNPNSMSGIDLFEKCVRSSKRTDIQNLTPTDLEALLPKDKLATKDASIQEIHNVGDKHENMEHGFKGSSSMLHALLLKKYILEYKVNDLAKRAETIRYLLNNEIILPDSDTSLTEPDYGAFCYFVLTKFYDPFLIKTLLQIEVPLVTVFELTVEGEFYRRKSLNNMLFLEELKQRLDSIDNFWDEFMVQLNDPENIDMFSEFLFLPIKISSEQWHNKKRADVLLEYILLKLLSINKLMRKFIHYINNIELIDAPTILTEGKMDIYNKLLDSIPLECVTIELILHCLVEQVVAHFEGIQNEPYIDNFEYDFEEKEIKYPLLFINHRDKIKRMTFNLKTNNQLNLGVISSKMHSLMSYATIWNYYPSQIEVEKALNANQIKKLITCATEVISEDKFLILLHLISFNKLLFIANYSHSLKISKWIYDQQLLSFLSILDKKENSKNTKENKASSDLHSNILPKRLVHLNSLKSFLDCNEFDSLISYDFLGNLYEFCYTEDLSKETLLQILNKAYSNYLHFDHYYSPLTDKLLMWFHNFSDENGLYTRIQEGLLNAKIGFGDFYTYPDNETAEWLSNQKKQITLVDEALKKKYLSRNFSDINPLSFVLNPSIKVKIPYPKKEYMNKKVGKIPFSKVYNSFGLGRIKVSEQTDIFFSIDGPSLTFKKTKWLRKDGYFSIILNSHHHLLTLHQSLLNLDKPPAYDPNQEIFFNIESNKGIIVSSCLSITEDVPLFSEPKKGNEAHYETLITLPNGLVIELFRGKYNFIKQTFLDKNHLEDDNLKQEDYRIFLNDGTILVFMNDGSILILYCNSTEARIKIVGKKPHRSLNVEVKEQQDTKKDYNISKEDEEMAFEIIRHEIIGWNGKFLRFNRDDIILSKPLYELRTAFCTERGLFTARSDGTKCYVDFDGILTVSFPDKTITTVIPTKETFISKPSDSNAPSNVAAKENEDEDSFEIINNKYIMDHPYYMKVEFVSEQWIIHLPFGGRVSATTKGFELAFDKYTNIDFNGGLVTVVSKNRLNENKNTVTSLFLKGEIPFEYTICSIESSEGKVFNVSNTGVTSLTTVQKIALQREESMKKNLEHIVPKKKKSQDHMSLIRLSLNQKKSESYATKHLKNQILLYTKVDVQIEKGSNTNIATTNPIYKFSNTKQSHRFFVLNRDLSGYEFINEYDIKSMLIKYQTNFKVFQPFLPCTSTTNDITVCQLPLMKTWNQLFWTACSNSRLYNTNLKKNELLNIPTNQKWLCISTNSIPNHKINNIHYNEPITDNISLKHPAMLIRRIKNIKTEFIAFNMFKEAVNQFNHLNCEILYKFEKRLLPTLKQQSDIEKTEMIYKNALEELMQSKIAAPITALTKGDSISTIGSSVTSIKVDESDDSDETDSQRNPTGSVSESTNK